MRNMLKKVSILFFLVSLAPFIHSKMEPIKKNGRYYYTPYDTYEHINLQKALMFLGKKILSPSQWINKISSLFYSQPTKHINANTILRPIQSIPDQEQSQDHTITWIGHSTFLIRLGNFNILTDPIFGDVKAGPFTITKRGLKPGIQLKDLPHIHCIVLSHNHADHCDMDSLKALAQKFNPVIYAPAGTKTFLESLGFRRVVTNTWWANNNLKKDGKELKITCLPAYHWSIRFSLGSYRKTLWCSWMIQLDDFTLYFAGDTAMGPHFKEIAQEFPKINVALMPIGPTENGENKHKESHVDARGAIDAFLQLNADCFVPMHYGTFFISESTLTTPIKVLHSYWEEHVSANKKLLFARCGQEYQL